MMAGLPLTAWLLLLAVIVIPLSIELPFFFAHYNAADRRSRRATRQERAR